jgi:predicted dehydrogenase
VPSKIRLAVIGTGHLGRIHARLAAENDAFQLVAVVDAEPEISRSVARQLGTESYATHESIVGRVDAAVVATPTVSHHRVGLDLLNHGIHLLVEKPLAATLAEADDLARAAARQGCILQVGHIERFNPALTAVAEQIRAPKFIEARRYSGYSFRSTDIGVVLDVMIHDLDLILSLVPSEPVRVEALGVSIMGGHEDAANARIAFADGCVADVSASRVSYNTRREMQIWSPECFVGIDFAGPAATIVRPTEALQTLTTDAMSMDEKLAAKNRVFQDQLKIENVQPEPCNALADELADFADAIHRAAPPRVPGTAGRDAVALCQQILDSIKNHTWDGRIDGRRGPQAPWATPTLPGPASWPADGSPPLRRAG